MHEEEQFKKRIYEYCGNNLGRDILFSGFTNLWIQPHQEISPKDLATLTSGIVNDLIKDGILEEISKPADFDVPYGMYKILPHNK